MIPFEVLVDTMAFFDRKFMEVTMRRVASVFSIIIEEHFPDVPHHVIHELYIHLNKRYLYLSGTKTKIPSQIWKANGKNFLKVAFPAFRAEWLTGKAAIPPYLRAKEICITRDTSGTDVPPCKTIEIIFHRLGRAWANFDYSAMIWYCDDSSLRPLFDHVASNDCADLTIRLLTFLTYETLRPKEIDADAERIAAWLHTHSIRRCGGEESLSYGNKRCRLLKMFHASPHLIEPLTRKILERFTTDINQCHFMLRIEYKSLKRLAQAKRRRLRKEITGEVLCIDHLANLLQISRVPFSRDPQPPLEPQPPQQRQQQRQQQQPRNELQIKLEETEVPQKRARIRPKIE